MRNYVQSGNAVTVAAPYGLTSGDGALLGALFGIAATTATEGQKVELVTTGVFTLGKATGETWGVGARVYWDDAAKVCTTADEGNALVGVALLPANGSATTGRVRLNGSTT